MSRLTRWLGLLAALSLCSPLRAQGEQVLANPGFEQLDDAGRPSGWQVDEGLQVLGGADVVGGEHAVRVRYQSGLRQDLRVQAGEIYRIEGSTRRPPGEAPLTGRVLIRWLDDDGAKVRGNTDYHHTAGTEWARFTHIISIPDGCTHIHLVVDGPYQTADWFDFDELSMVRTSRLASIDTRALEACSRPLRAVRVADCGSFALLRLPGSMEAPYDGKVETFATMSPYVERPNPHTEVDFDFTFHRPEEVDLCLIHTVADPLERATLLADVDGRWREVARIENGLRTLLAASFDPVVTRCMRLRIHKRPEDETISLNEVQFFGPGTGGIDDLAALQRAQAPPQDFAEVLEHASGSGGPAAVAVEGGGGGEVDLRAGHTLEILLPRAETEVGLDRVAASLACEGSEPGRAVEVALMSPNTRDRNIRSIHLGDRVLTGRHARGLSAPPNIDLRALARIVVPLVPGEQNAVASIDVDIPDMIVRPGERVWLRVTPLQDETVLLDESGAAAVEIPAGEALPEYLPDLERILRRAYAQCSEAHVYDGAQGMREAMALVRLLREVQALDPDNEAARRIEHRIFRTRERVELERPGPVDAPDWAVWQRRLLQEYTRIVHWWIDTRQISTGELGGAWADDTELSCEWAFLPLATGDEKVRDSLALVAEGVWKVVGEGGYSPRTMDAEHAAEYVTLSQPQMMLLDYGDPLYIERCMRMIKHMEWWTLINEQGHRHFRSYMFNATSIDDSEGHDFDHVHTAYAAKPGFYAAWYSANEQPRGWLTEWAWGWHAAAMSTDKGKPAGAIPYDVHARTGEIAPYTDRWDRSAYMNDGLSQVKDLFIGAWDWTGDPAVLEPLRYHQGGGRAADMTWRMLSGDTARDEQIIESAERMIEENQRLNGSDEENSWSAYNMYSELRYYWAWWATGEMRYLVEGLQEQCRNIERMRWLITEAEPYTDRAYIPGDRLLPFMMLGGSAGEVRATYPDLAVSWERLWRREEPQARLREGTGTDVATLVTERTAEAFTVLAHSFADAPLAVVMRTWSVPAGHWAVTLGIDTDADGFADETLGERHVELFRYAALPITLRPGVTTVITARLIEPGEDIRARADLAISERDLRREGDQIAVTVHNIGASDVPAGVQVVAEDADGRAVETITLPAIPAPVRCVPSTVEVRLGAAKLARIRLDADDTVPEITECNNELAVRP